MPIRFIQRLALALTVAVTVASCGKDDVSPDGYRIDSLNLKFLVGDNMSPGPITGTPATDPASRNLTYFSYKDKKVQLRFGGWFQIAPAGSIYTVDLYDSVAYSGNHITILPRARNVFTAYLVPQRDIWFDSWPNGDRIKKLITSFNNANDTTDYYYGSNSRISKTVTHNGLRTITKTFTFNSKGNLEKVNTNTNDTTFDEETFEGYDNAPNQLKSFGIWEDLYYRSLSANNFTSYSRKTTGPGTDYSTFNMTIALKNLSNGHVDYSK